MEIAFRNGLQLAHLLDVIHQFPVEFPAKEDDREILDLAGLDEGQRFEEFIQSPESPGDDDKGVGVFDQQRLPDEEVSDIDPLIEVRVGVLLHREHDVAAHRAAADILGTSIGCFHETGSAPGHDGESQLGDLGGQSPRQIVIRARFRKTSGTKHRHTRSGKVQGPEAANKLPSDIDHELEVVPARARAFEKQDLWVWHKGVGRLSFERFQHRETVDAATVHEPFQKERAPPAGKCRCVHRVSCA